MILKDGQRYYSIGEAAQLCGLQRATFTNRVKRGTVAKPATQIGQKKYYSEEQLTDVKREMLSVIKMDGVQIVLR